MSSLKRFGLVTILITIVLQGCEPPAPGLWHNKEIPDGTRADFDKLNHSIFDNLNSNRPDLVEDMFSSELLSQNTDRHTESLLSRHTASGHFSVFDEWYIVSKERGQRTLTSKKNGSVYHLDIPIIAPEMYVSELIPDEVSDKYLITAIYSKLSYGWRLTTLSLNPYTIDGKTAVEWYNVALHDYEQKYLVESVFRMDMANKCLNPGDRWTYAKDFEMRTFFSKITAEANTAYKFPYTINLVSTKPAVFNLFCDEMPEGNFPMIYYLTKIDLKDTQALIKENNEIKSVIGKVFPGIDKDKKMILFEAYNQKTTIYKTVPSVDFTYELK